MGIALTAAMVGQMMTGYGVQAFAAEKDVTITVTASAGWIRDVDRELAKKFEEETGIKVDIQANPDDQYEKVLMTRLASGEGPDIYMGECGIGLERYQPDSYALDLSDEEWVARYPDWMIDQASYDGKIVGFTTWGRDFRAMLYNKDIFEEYGIEVFDPQKGFLLNGEPYLIKGTCNHQDFAGVGVALPDSLIEYKLRKLKEMGCNAYRSAHHPASEKLLELCDHIGLLVLNENRKLDSTEQGKKELEEMISGSRNHVCIFMWSLENEEILEGTIMGRRILKSLCSLAHKLDPYRPVTAAMNHGWNESGYGEAVDVVGYNYGQRNGQDVSDHQRFPGRRSVGTESASCTVTRGIYETDREKGYCSEYGTCIPEWGCSVEKAWSDVLEHPELSGVFVWTGFDYRGEPTPFSWPNIHSHFGVMDTCGFPKSTYYYLKAHWTEEPVLFIMPHWDWAGDEGAEKRVWIETNCDEVALFLNGNFLGQKKRTGAVHLEWQVRYVSGILEAVGYTQGKETIRSRVVTPESPAQIELIPEKTKAKADGESTICAEVSLLDAQGNVVVTSDREIRFAVDGAAHILGVGNGDPSCHEPDKASQRSTFGGKCLVILQTERYPGRITLRASAENMKDSIIELEGVSGE